MRRAALAALTLGLVAPMAATQTVSFDDQKPGEAARGFSCVLTGKGRPGVWTIETDATAPTPPRVLAQTDEDSTGYRFPVCVLDAVSAADVDLSVRFRAVKGSTDQAAGVVWRFRDRDNYYLLRANALENNLVLYKVEAGKRTDLKPKGAGMFAYGRKVKVPSGVWGTLRVVAKGPVFQAYLNGEELFEVEDRTFVGAGKIGVWTKADSVTYFDDLRVVVDGEK
jgi:3-keto-disaccharide hydrolase